MPDSTIAISPIYKDIIPGTLKEKIDKYAELQQFINNLPQLFRNAQQIKTTHKLTDSSSTRQSLTQQTDQVSPQPKFAGLIRSSFIWNPDKTSEVVVAQISSFTPSISKPSVNEADEGTFDLEGNDQATLDE